MPQVMGCTLNASAVTVVQVLTVSFNGLYSMSTWAVFGSDTMQDCVSFGPAHAGPAPPAHCTLNKALAVRLVCPLLRTIDSIGQTLDSIGPPSKHFLPTSCSARTACCNAQFPLTMQCVTWPDAAGLSGAEAPLWLPACCR
jgi:hypothetical protein